MTNIAQLLEERDMRPQRSAWAPGGYLCRCVICKKEFVGDKRAVCCAPCAYDPINTLPNPL